jgi:murein DD-endopeptidase MepM/ murein hydrolase activator NlpD
MRIKLAGLMEEKKRSLSERRAELDSVRKTASDLAKSVEDLNGLFAKLDQVSKQVGAPPPEAVVSAAPPAPPASAAPATPEPPAATAPPPSEQGTTQNAAPDPAAPAPPPTGEVETALVVPPPEAKPAGPKIVELAPGRSLVPGSSGRIAPSISFQEAKGKLPLPAQGRRVLSFGDKTQYGGQSKGIVIETRWSAQITSPCDGWIVYAGEFRSYGQLLIINAGGGYHVLLAGLSQIDVQPGQFVLAAEPVGTMSGTPKAAPQNPPVGGPVLYVEFRNSGEPINPDPWWVQRQEKAQSEQKVQG